MRSPSSVHYRISPKNPSAHLFEVTCVIQQPDPNGQQLSLPVWIPGSYLIREFAKNIVSISATCAEQPIAIEKQNKYLWHCAPCSGPLTVTYEVYAFDLSVRGAYLDTTRGFFNGTGVFLRVVGQENSPCSIEIVAPSGEAYAKWRVATTLPIIEVNQHGFGYYQAANYDELIDHPVEMSELSVVEFEACQIPHTIAISGRHRADLARLALDLAKVCEAHIRFFGEPAPFDCYLFLVMTVGEGYGGLEHRSSTSLLCSRDDLPVEHEAGISESYRSFLGLASHEYFHAWNVKRLKPAVFTPYDLTQENYTRLLWAFEGVTSYYDDLALVRCQLITPESYLELLAKTITSVLRTPGRLKQTAAEASFDTWIKYYRPDENSPNAQVSYYTKGALIALALDLTIRQQTNHQSSLDQVMRTLWQRYGQPLIGVAEKQWEAVAQEVTGLDLQPFFDLALRSTDELPLATLLQCVGVEYQLRPAESMNDGGGKPASRNNQELLARPAFGAKVVNEHNQVILKHVFDVGAAQLAGLAAGDSIVAIEGIRISAANFERIVTNYPVGHTLQVHAFRRDELMTLQLTLMPPTLDTCVLRLIEEVDEATRQHRERWLLGEYH